MKAWIKQFGQWFFPNQCAMCKQLSPAAVCDDCCQDLPWNDHCCHVCALPMVSKQQKLCGVCLKKPLIDCEVKAALLYESPLRELIHGYKVQDQPYWARSFAYLINQYLQQGCQLHRPEALLAVPMHPQALRQRGYNQAILLAKQLSVLMKIPVIYLCRKIKSTDAQRLLHAKARHKNLNGAFIAHPSIQDYGSIAMIDDVLTTGSTIQALSQAIKLQHPTINLQAWCLARAY